MIIAADGGEVSAPGADQGQLRELAAVLQAHPARFEWDPKRAGLDVRAADDLQERPNRGRLKAWTPRPGTLLLFLYKDSQVPCSTDRFAYGALVIRGPELPRSEVRQVLDYLLSGLHPDQRPACLKRAFPFTIPR